MHLLFAPLFSGSGGNSIYVGNEEGAVLVDAGVSATAIINELKANGLDPGSIRALLVTHEHSDHMQGLGALARRLRVPVYATPGTWEGMGRRPGKLDPLNMRCVERGVDFYVGNMNVLPFATPHDANEPCGYAFSLGGIRAAVATDMGHIRPEWLNCVLGSDIVLLESNYDTDMLIAGPYPYELKRRIKGLKGHLSNDDAGKSALRLAQSGTRTIILGHLSEHNNYPELAYETCRQALYEGGYYDFDLHVARRSGCGGVFEIRQKEI